MSDVKQEKMLLIPKIERGFVIDHIPVGMGIRVLEILTAEPGMKDVVTTVGLNYSSRRLGRKDMVKIVSDEIPARAAEILALVSPGITIKHIRNFQVDEKLVVAPPAEILGHVKCRNPNCITNNERGMRTHFKATRRDPHLYRCVFCERVFPLSELEMTVS